MIDNETIKQASEMRKAHLNLVRYALNKGYNITVHYGNGEGKEDCEYSTDYNNIKECVEACDESYINIYNPEKQRVGWAWVVFGNDDNELVADYGVNEFMETWATQFENMYEATK